MNLQENISTRLKRRAHLIDRVIYIMLQNMYPCDYNSSDHFVEGVLDEIRWFLLDVEELQGIERVDIENYIFDYKYDELTEYFNERCVVLKNDNLQETIRRILREDRFKGQKRFLKDNIFTDFPEYVINDMFRESGDSDYSEVQGMTKDQIIDYFFNGEGKQYFDRWGGYEGKNAKVVKIEWNDLTEPLQKFLKTKMSGEHPASSAASVNAL